MILIKEMYIAMPLSWRNYQLQQVKLQKYLKPVLHLIQMITVMKSCEWFPPPQKKIIPAEHKVSLSILAGSCFCSSGFPSAFLWRWQICSFPSSCERRLYQTRQVLMTKMCLLFKTTWDIRGLHGSWIWPVSIFHSSPHHIPIHNRPPHYTKADVLLPE